MRLRQFIEKARRNIGLPQTVHAAVGGKIDFRPLARAGQPDMGEPALFFEPGAAGIVERALVRK